MSHVDDGALHAYLDGELTPVERARLDAHLAECDACRARLDEERGLIERASQLLGLAQPPERAAPPPLHQLRHPRLVWRLRMPLAWAATVVLALGLGYYAGGMSFRAMPASRVGLADSAPAVAMSDENEAAPAHARTPAPSAPRTPQRAAATEAKAIIVGAVRQDTVAAATGAAGAVSIRVPELRPVPPAPAPSADKVAVQRETDVAAARGRLVATEWPVIRRAPARQLLGTDPVGVPGLAVREMRSSPAGDGVVLVEQQLDSATVIQLFQRRAEQLELARGVVTRGEAPAARAAAPQMQAYVGTERLARFIGPLRVEIAGPLTSDSLNKLLELLKPLP
ncbi:MAG TPA: zf-HC2 domain-containing protein [Gemmatimonadales bacterium]